MRALSRLVFCFLLSLLLFVPAAGAAQEVSWLNGSWTIDVEETIKTMPELPDELKANMRSTPEELLPVLAMDASAKQITMQRDKDRGGKVRVVTIVRVKVVNASTVHVTTQEKGRSKKEEVVFKRLPNDRLSIAPVSEESVISIWKRKAEGAITR